MKDVLLTLFDIKLFNVGLRNATDDDERRIIRIINVTSCTAILFTLFYQFYYFFYGWWNLIAFNITMCCFYGLVLMLNWKFSYRFAAIFLTLVAITQLFVVTNVYLSAESGIHYFLLTIPPFCFLIIHKQDSLWRGILMLIALAAFIFTEYITLHSPFNVNASENDLTLLHILSTTGTLFMLTTVVAIFSIDIGRVKKALAEEHKRSESLLLNILPEPIAARLKTSQQTIAEACANTSILFADIVGFTKLSSQITPGEVVSMLNKYFTAYDDLSIKYNLEKIKTIGDAYMVVAGIPEKRSDHAEAIMKMAIDMLEVTRTISKELNQTLTIRIGINSGAATAGVIGKRKFSYDLWGDAVNIASRMESQGVPGRIQVAEATFNLLKEKYSFESRRTIDIKGKGVEEAYLVKA